VPAGIRLSVKELDDLIAETEANGGDASELKKFRGEIPVEERPAPAPRRERTLSVDREEETTGDRLNREVGPLFPGGVTDEILKKLIELDGKYTLTELRTLCIKAGFSPNGQKKKLAAKLLSNGKI